MDALGSLWAMLVVFVILVMAIHAHDGLDASGGRDASKCRVVFSVILTIVITLVMPVMLVMPAVARQGFGNGSGGGRVPGARGHGRFPGGGELGVRPHHLNGNLRGLYRYQARVPLGSGKRSAVIGFDLVRRWESPPNVIGNPLYSFKAFFVAYIVTRLEYLLDLVR